MTLSITPHPVSARTLLWVACLLLLAGCGAKKSKVGTGAANPSASGAPAEVGSGPESANGRVSGPGVAPRDVSAGPAPTSGDVGIGTGSDKWIEEGPATSTDPNLKPIYFDFDSDKLSGDGRATLERNVAYLKSHPKLGVVLRGHTDSHGSPEYNLALGSRRALAVMEALIAAGIPPERVETVSFGEEIPAIETDDETKESQNRRVEFFVYTID